MRHSRYPKPSANNLCPSWMTLPLDSAPKLYIILITLSKVDLPTDCRSPYGLFTVHTHRASEPPTRRRCSHYPHGLYWPMIHEGRETHIILLRQPLQLHLNSRVYWVTNRNSELCRLLFSLFYLTMITPLYREGHRLSSFLLALQVKPLITETTLSALHLSEWNCYLFPPLASTARHYRRKEGWGT